MPECGKVLMVLTCDLPAGHPEDEHHVAMPLPPDIGRMIVAAMGKYEEAATHAERARAKYRSAMHWAWVMAGAWLTGLLWYVWLILT